MVRIKKLVWDEWNIAHIARHDVIPDEVEQVCHGEYVVQLGKKGRSLIFGSTKSLRIITIVIDPLGNGAYYPVTARPASQKERLIYKQEKGGGIK